MDAPCPSPVFLSHRCLPLIPWLLTAPALAQPTFLRIYNEGNSGHAVRQVNGGDLLVAGGTDLYFNWHWNLQSPVGSTHVHLFRTDQAGALVWERVHAIPGSRTLARWMEPTPDGGTIIAGMANHDQVWPPDSNDVLVIKTDGSGLVSWARIFDSGTDELGYCVRPTNDGGYIVSGFHDALPVSLVLTTHAVLIKLDAAGNTEWVKKYPLACRDLNTHEPFPYVVTPLSDGGYAVAGTTVGAHPADVCVIRTDANGNVLWARSYEHSPAAWRISTGQDIVEAPNGDLIIAGSMDKSQPLEPNHPFVLRIDAGGALLYASIFEAVPAVPFQAGFSSVVRTPDGGYFFTGMGGYSGFGDHAQLLKTDAALNMTWSRVYTMDGTSTVGARSGRPTSDGGYVFTGKRQFSGTVLMKTDANGMIACKAPTALVPIAPDILTIDRAAVPVPGMPSFNVLLTTTSPLLDTTTLCPFMDDPLPIALGALTATVLPSDQVLTEWTTFSENDNALFVVQRGSDGTTFEAIGEVAGTGSSVQPTQYAFLDAAPLPVALSYYRLQQIDVDGSTTFSPVVAVRIERSPLALIAAWCEGSSERLLLEIADDREEPANVTIIDALGRSLRTDRFLTARGRATRSLDARGLPSGTLAVRIDCGARSLVGRVVH